MVKVSKLNCAACGAPISVPNDMETLFCSSCGSKLMVERDDGVATLKLVEKLTQAIQDSGDRTQSAIKDNTYVTKAELKRMQISQTINTEAMKQTTLQQEIRTLQRKTQLTQVERDQLSELRINELGSQLNIRKQHMELCKLDEGWEESMTVFQADLDELNKIIAYFAPCAIDPKTQQALNDLVQERIRCEKTLIELEKKLLSRQLKFIKYEEPDRLGVEEMESLREAIAEDRKILLSPPKSQVKNNFLDQALQIEKRLDAIYPRKKVESATGVLKSLDLQPPYSESPIELMPLIALADDDLAKVNESPENPSKYLIKDEIQRTASFLKARRDLDIPGQRLRAEIKRKKRKKAAWITVLIFFGLIGLIIVISAISKEIKTNKTPTPSAALSAGTQEEMVVTSSTQDEYQTYSVNLLEIVAQRTYLRPEPDINSDEGAELRHGDLLIDLGKAEEVADWCEVQLFAEDTTGYLYEQWISPVSGESTRAKTFVSGYSSRFYDEGFSGEDTLWGKDIFADSNGEGEYSVSNGVYQIRFNARKTNYAYSMVNLPNLPADFLVELTTTPIKNETPSASGLVINYIDPDHFDFFVVTSEETVIIGAQRHGVTQRIYNTEETPNSAPIYADGNDLSVYVKAGDRTGTTWITYIINGFQIFSMEYTHPQEFKPVIGVIVFSEKTGSEVSFSFDNINVYNK